MWYGLVSLKFTSLCVFFNIFHVGTPLSLYLIDECRATSKILRDAKCHRQWNNNNNNQVLESAAPLDNRRRRLKDCQFHSTFPLCRHNMTQSSGKYAQFDDDVLIYNLLIHLYFFHLGTLALQRNMSIKPTSVYHLIYG